MNDHAGPTRIDYAAVTDPGRVRAANQDAVLATCVAASRVFLFAVADGVGGLTGGAEASALALETVARAVNESATPVIAIREAIERVNATVFEQGAAAGRPSGTTIVVALIIEGELRILHAGDSRAYLLRRDRLTRLTRDHSWVAEQVRSGAMTNAAAATSPYRNIITRAVGVEPQLELEERPAEPCEPGDLLLLCSDGLHGLVNDAEIEALLLGDEPGDLQALAHRLVDLANTRGGTDNVSVVLARVLAVPELPATRPRDDVRTAVTRQISLDVR